MSSSTAEPEEPAFFASCSRGIEPLLADELRALGATGVRETRAGVAFAGRLVTAYRACLWSRLASRILMPLARFPAPTADALYAGTQAVAWREHLRPDATLAVDAVVSHSAITHSHFAALRVKDAIVDRLRAEFGRRPSVDTARPDLRVNLYLHRDEAVLSIDLSGESLHRRGYRASAREAPLKENLAAAVLIRADWPALAVADAALVDPMCGAGTLPIEAALMAADIAPGLLRTRFGFHGWLGHDGSAWEQLLAEARERRHAGLARLPRIRGYDRDPHAIEAARRNLARTGLDARVAFEVRTLADCAPETSEPAGLVVANPPYGERLGEAAELETLYRELGDALKRCFAGWRAAVLTGNPALGQRLGLRARKFHTLYNGALECRLLHFDVAPQWYHREPLVVTSTAELGPGAETFANRLRKNFRHYGRWARRQGIGAYRVYDADLHEFNMAIDVYESAQRLVHVQEYRAPASVDPRLAARRLRQALTVIGLVLEVPAERVYVKVRERQRGRAQYQRFAQTGEFHEVREGPARLLVNLADYLDSGLFLDHRPTRLLLGELARGRRFLNLFGYTGSATVHAALGNAPSSVTVDMSRTYLDWARRNFALNGLDPGRHTLVQADVVQWLESYRGPRFDLIFLDPPTFSRSKRMEETLDVQRDHVQLLRTTTRLLAPAGVLIFSTNYQRFKLDSAALSGLSIEDITPRTLPKDFERNPRIHRCFRIVRATDG